MEIEETSIIQPLPSELKELQQSNVVELKAFDVNKSWALDTAITVVSQKTGMRNENQDMTPEFQIAFQRADLLRKASMKHSWTRATVMTIARSAIGSGFSIIRHPVFGRQEEDAVENRQATFKDMANVYTFLFGNNDEDIKYIQDIQPNASKIMYTIASLVFYGQAAWEIIKDENGVVTGYNVLPGFVFPNVRANGKFKRPAYFYRPWNSMKTYEFKNPKDIVYITWPGTDMSIFGSSEYIAAAESSIPSDLYAAAVYRAHFENINAPFNGFWIVDKETKDEDFKKFMSLVFNRYTGVKNFGRNPIVIRGSAEFKEMRSRSNDDAPYMEGRRYNQEEISAVSGVSSSKLGLGSNVNRTNFREQRRDFWETTLRPIYAIVEEAIYQQVFVRIFNKREWMLSFNQPDQNTQLEQSSILTRYYQNGVMNPNEIRYELKMPPRIDEWGDKYYDPAQIQTVSQEQKIGDQQDTRNQSGQNRANENESDRSGDMKRPPTSDRPQSEEGSPNKNVISELRTWKKFASKVADKKRSYRAFESEHISKDTASQIELFIQENIDNKDEIKLFFEELIDLIEI